MKRTEEFKIPDNVAVVEDKKTKAKSIYFPIEFNDSSHGLLILTRLKAFPWRPNEHIKSIIINHNDDKTAK